MATSLIAHCYPNPRTGVGLSSGVAGEDAAMLAEGHWIGDRLPLKPIRPRPDSFTRSFDRHRNFHSSFRYRIPVGVQGGARPFLYTLLVAPVGATISNKGVVDWMPTGQTGSQRFTVQVVDQDGNKATLTWTATLNDAAFVFIDSKVAVSGDGTFASPLKLFSDWYKGSVNDATYHNKIAVFVGGGDTYNVIGDAVNANGNVSFNLSTKNNAVIGDPDSRPVFNCSAAKFYSNIKLDGLFVAHIDHEYGRQDVDNPHFWWAASNPDDICFFENDFSNIGYGLVGTDNTGAIFISDGDCDGVVVKGNTYHDINNAGGGNGTYVTIFECENVLIENERAWDCITGTGWNAKGTFDSVTIYDIEAIDNVQGTQVGIGYGSECGRPPANHEACYLNLHVSNDVAPFIAANSAYYAASGAQPVKSSPIAVYRCTFTGGSAWIRNPGVPDHLVDANVVVTNLTNRWELDSMTTEVSNVVATSATNLVDLATGNLTGAGLSYLYTKGHQVG